MTCRMYQALRVWLSGLCAQLSLTRAYDSGKPVGTMNPDERFQMLIGVLVFVALPAYAVWKLILWVRAAPCRPDPWDAQTEEIAQNPDTLPTCHRCSAPYSHEQWFCAHCGTAVGKYNNWMPYIYTFSVGEVFRNGVTDRIRINALTATGYFVLTLSNYIIFAPIYWYFLFKNLKRIRREESLQSSDDKQT